MKKRILLMAASSFFLIAAAKDMEIEPSVLFQESYCKEPKVTIKESTNKYWEYFAEKARPNFVLDFFQDPGRNGVDIAVAIETTELVAAYYKWEEVCAPVAGPEYGMRSDCTPDSGREPGVIYRWERQCVQQPPETTYRSIKPETVSVWLDVSRESRGMLGPGPFYEDTKRPVLRYLYPDQWAVKVVRPEDMTIVEKPGFDTPQDVIDFLKANKDYIILESGAKGYVLETRMKTLYRRSMYWPAFTLVDNGRCVAGENATGLDAGLTALAGGEHICSFRSDTYNEAVNTYVIEMKKIPLDLPGEWYIGVGFDMEYASFDGGNGHEPGFGTVKYVFSDVDMERRFSFESYILRSAPCNPDEPGGCWNESE
jgi:hypothetical protein